jgi:hypothetical protein
MKPFSAAAATLLAVVSLAHLLRAIERWPATVDGLPIPIWASIVAFIVAGGLSVMVWRERRA